MIKQHLLKIIMVLLFSIFLSTKLVNAESESIAAKYMTAIPNWVNIAIYANHNDLQSLPLEQSIGVENWISVLINNTKQIFFASHGNAEDFNNENTNAENLSVEKKWIAIIELNKNSNAVMQEFNKYTNDWQELATATKTVYRSNKYEVVFLGLNLVYAYPKQFAEEFASIDENIGRDVPDNHIAQEIQLCKFHNQTTSWLVFKMDPITRNYFKPQITQVLNQVGFLLNFVLGMNKQQVLEIIDGISSFGASFIPVENEEKQYKIKILTNFASNSQAANFKKLIDKAYPTLRNQLRNQYPKLIAILPNLSSRTNGSQAILETSAMNLSEQIPAVLQEFGISLGNAEESESHEEQTNDNENNDSNNEVTAEKEGNGWRVEFNFSWSFD